MPSANSSALPSANKGNCSKGHKIPLTWGYLGSGKMGSASKGDTISLGIQGLTLTPSTQTRN
jgi:hypothetical protein